MKLVVSVMKLKINANVMDRMVEGIDPVIGMNAIHQLGEVLINGDGVDFRAAKGAVAVHLSEDLRGGQRERGNGHRR